MLKACVVLQSETLSYSALATLPLKKKRGEGTTSTILNLTKGIALKVEETSV